MKGVACLPRFQRGGRPAREQGCPRDPGKILNGAAWGHLPGVLQALLLTTCKPTSDLYGQESVPPGSGY